MVAVAAEIYRELYGVFLCIYIHAKKRVYIYTLCAYEYTYLLIPHDSLLMTNMIISLPDRMII